MECSAERTSEIGWKSLKRRSTLALAVTIATNLSCCSGIEALIFLFSSFNFDYFVIACLASRRQLESLQCYIFLSRRISGLESVWCNPSDPLPAQGNLRRVV